MSSLISQPQAGPGEGRAGCQGHRVQEPEAGSSLCSRLRSWDPAGRELRGSQHPAAEMGTLEEELQDTADDVLGKLKSGQLFQSSWDTAALIVFLVFVGTVLLLLLLVLFHCCCCCSCCPCGRHSRPSRAQKDRRRGMDNLALEP